MDIKSDNLKREFTHSLSRITDRMDQVAKGYELIQEDTQRIWRDAESAKQDIAKLKAALESMSNDLLTMEIKKCPS